MDSTSDAKTVEIRNVFQWLLFISRNVCIGIGACFNLGDKFGQIKRFAGCLNENRAVRTVSMVPLMFRLSAIIFVAQRKPTPCTRPRTTICFASLTKKTLPFLLSRAPSIKSFQERSFREKTACEKASKSSTVLSPQSILV